MCMSSWIYRKVKNIMRLQGVRTVVGLNLQTTNEHVDPDMDVVKYLLVAVHILSQAVIYSNIIISN